MGGRRRKPVPRNANESDQTFFACSDGRLQSATRAERRLPGLGFHQVVQLDHVDLVDA